MSAYGQTRDQNVELLVRTALEYGVTDTRQIAYILATAQHESDNFRTSREYDGPRQASRLGYSGGSNYYGRGFVQLTHDHRYEKMAQVMGDPRIVRDPDVVAREPHLGSRTTVVGMVRGLYTGLGLDQFINDHRKDYVGARAIVNGNDRAARVAGYAEAWERQVPALVERVSRAGFVPRHMPGSPVDDGELRRGEKGPEVRRLQDALVREGATMNPDGSFGRGTELEVKAWQRRHGMPATGVADHDMLERLGVEPQQGQQRRASETGDSRSAGQARETDDALRQALRNQVGILDAQAGKPWDDASERLAASALMLAKENGFTARDELKLAFNRATDRMAAGEVLHLARTGAASSPDPAANRVHMAVSDALAMPAEQRLQLAQGAGQQSLLHVAERDALALEQKVQGPEPHILRT